MTQATIMLPTGIDSKVINAVLKRASDEFGGFTVTTCDGGWVNPDGELITEPVKKVEVAGAGETWAKSTAQWVAKKTDETEVMWQVSNVSTGFEK